MEILWVILCICDCKFVCNFVCKLVSKCVNECIYGDHILHLAATGFMNSWIFMTILEITLSGGSEFAKGWSDYSKLKKAKDSNKN